MEVLASEEREISVLVDPERLTAAKLTIDQVADALKATNQVNSVGRLPKDYRQYLVLATAELTNLDEVRDVVVAFKEQTPIYVRDLAEVREGVLDKTTLVSGDGKPAALVSVSRQIRGNIIDVVDGARAAIESHTLVAAADGSLEGRLRPGGVREVGGRERARRDPHRRVPGRPRPDLLPARLAGHLHRGHLAPAHADRHLLGPAPDRGDRST